MREDVLLLIAGVVIGYLLGSLPVAHLAARSAGVDIFAVGTGNPGAANIFREVSRKLGALVYVADVGKGAAAVFIARGIGIPDEWLPVAAGASVAGHWLPVFLRFRGGAGLAVAIGATIALAPLAGVIAMSVGLAALAVIKSSGHAAAAGVVTALAISWPLGVPWAMIVGMTGLSLMLLARLVVVERLLAAPRKAPQVTRPS